MADTPSGKSSAGTAIPDGQTPLTPEQIKAEEKQGSQDPLAPVIDPKGVDVLDSIRDQLVASEVIVATEVDPDKPEDKPAEDKPAEDKPAEDKPTEDKPAEDKPEDKPADKPEDKPADKPEDQDSIEKDFNKSLDEVQLPSHAREKSATAFAKVKELARKRDEELTAELAKVTQELTELKAKSQNVPPSEELEALRAKAQQFERLQFAQDAAKDPKVVELDSKIEENDKAILTQFERAGATKEQIEQIKQIGGPAKVNWEPLLQHVTLATRRFIEAKLVENEGIRFNKSQTLESIQKDTDKWITEFEGRRKTAAEKLMKEARWLESVEIPATASEQDRKNLAAQNAHIKNLRSKVELALADRSPEMHATLAIGTAMAHDLNMQLNVALQRLEGIEEEHKKAVATVEKERDALKAELEKIKKASKGSSASRSSVAPGREENKPTRVESSHADGFSGKDPGSMLDALAGRVVASR